MESPLLGPSRWELVAGSTPIEREFKAVSQGDREFDERC